MKLSVSLSEQDVQTLDDVVREAGLSSRSAAVQRAIALLRHPGLERDYAAAWQEWDADDDQTAWDVTTGDGVDDAAR